jgi:hypothetical protein
VLDPDIDYTWEDMLLAEDGRMLEHIDDVFNSTEESEVM